jgi:hypothetical protein
MPGHYVNHAAERNARNARKQARRDAKLAELEAAASARKMAKLAEAESASGGRPMRCVMREVETR